MFAELRGLASITNQGQALIGSRPFQADMSDSMAHQGLKRQGLSFVLKDLMVGCEHS